MTARNHKDRRSNQESVQSKSHLVTLRDERNAGQHTVKGMNYSGYPEPGASPGCPVDSS